VAEREDFTVAPVPSGESWDLAGLEAISTSAVAGKVLAAMGDEDPDIVVLTADLKFSNQTVDFERAHPERFINVGISEQHMVTMAAGMASVGLKPYVATFAPFVGLLAGDRLLDLGMQVADHDRAPAAHHVDVLVAVHVPEARALGPSDEVRRPGPVHLGGEVSGDAPGEGLNRAFVEFKAGLALEGGGHGGILNRRTK
jgi:transketolase-like protein